MLTLLSFLHESIHPAKDGWLDKLKNIMERYFRYDIVVLAEVFCEHVFTCGADFSASLISQFVSFSGYKTFYLFCFYFPCTFSHIRNSS